MVGRRQKGKKLYKKWLKMGPVGVNKGVFITGWVPGG